MDSQSAVQQATIDSVAADLATDVQAEIDGIEVDVYASGGPAETFDTAIAAAERTFNNSVDLAVADYEGDLPAFSDTYNKAVNGTGRLRETLDGQIESEQSALDAAAQTARAT